MMKRLRFGIGTVVSMGVLMLAGCGSDSAAPVPAPAPAPAPAPTAIGPAGGTVTGPNGATIVVPAGALAQTVNLQIAQVDAAAANLPEGLATAGTVYALTPHGTSFAQPVTVTIPFDAAQVPQGDTVQLLKTTDEALTQWALVAGATTAAGALSAQVSTFSLTVPFVPRLPTITTQPAAQTVGLGQGATFSVAARANGLPPLTYQWQRDGVNIAGATAASYTLASTVQGDDGAQFSVVVGNGLGTVTSTQARLTIGTSTVAVRPLPRRIAVGLRSAAAVTADGSVWTWGENNEGQLGPGATPNQHRLQPARVTGITNAVAVFWTGRYGFAVLRSDGRVQGWGDPFLRALGEDPVDNGVRLLGITNVTQIAGGNSHVLALRSDGTVWAWGSNIFGQLGDGTRDTPFEPVQVSGLTGAVAIGGTGNGSMAVRGDGSAWAWGSHANELCLGQIEGFSTTPQRVTAATSFGQLVTPGVRTLLWNAAGALYACGYGDVTTISTASTVPQAVTVPPVATATAGGYYDPSASVVHPFIFTVDSSGLLTGYSSPQAAAIGVNGTTGVVEIVSDGASLLFVKADGSVWGWGINADGQLGDGTRSRRTTPAQVPGLNLN